MSIQPRSELNFPHHILESILGDWLGECLHEIMTLNSTLPCIQKHMLMARKKPSTEEINRLHQTISHRLSAMSRLRPILALCHTCRPFRSIMEKHITTLFPTQFQDTKSTLYSPNVLPLVFSCPEKYKDPHLLLASLMTLRGLAITCLTLTIQGLDSIDKPAPGGQHTFRTLQEREPACNTPIARIYLTWAKLRVTLNRHLESLRDKSLSPSPKTYALDLRSIHLWMPEWERGYLFRGIDDLIFLHCQLSISMMGRFLLEELGWYQCVIRQQAHLFAGDMPYDHPAIRKLGSIWRVLDSVQISAAIFKTRFGFKKKFKASPQRRLIGEIGAEMKWGWMDNITQLSKYIDLFYLKGENLSQRWAVAFVILMQLISRLFRMTCVKQEALELPPKSEWHRNDLD